jgi:hypothetical protein
MTVRLPATRSSPVVAPLQQQLGLDRLAQAGVFGDTTAAGTWLIVDGARAESPGDLTQREPLSTKCRGQLPFEQRQVPLRPLTIYAAKRRKAPAFGPPPIPGLTPDADQLAGRLHRANPGQDQLPVLILDSKTPLTTPSSQLHTLL